MGVQIQAIDHEMIAAAEMLGSDDPEEVAAGTAILEELLDVSESTQAALAIKADRALIVAEQLTQQAAMRKAIVDRLSALVKADKANADRLTQYVIKVLTTLAPSEKTFNLASHKLTSRKSEAVDLTSEIEEDPLGTLPKTCVHETVTYAPDKASIKTLLKQRDALNTQLEAATKANDGNEITRLRAEIKALPVIEGARVVQRTNWTVK